MKKIYETIIQAMDELELNYQRNDEEGIVDAYLRGENAAFQVRLAAMEDQEVLYCFAVFPINVPEDKRTAMSELINAINFDNLIGMLTFDPKDGQLFCRMSCSVDGGAINTTIVKVALGTVFRTLNDNNTAFIKILAA